MIAEKPVSLERDKVAIRANELAGASETPKVDDRESRLQDFVVDLRADACEDALFYLVRSNTSYDGE